MSTIERPATPLAVPARFAASPPRFTGSTAGALLCAGTAIAVGAITMTMHPMSMTISTGWAMVHLAVGTLVLAGRGQPWTRWLLAVLGASWAAYAGSAAHLAAAGSQPAWIAAVAWASLSLHCLRVALALGRRVA